MMHAPDGFRVKTGPLAALTAQNAGTNDGCFLIPFRGVELQVISSDGLGWEHVSVSLRNRNPNWDEMCFIKAMFWDEEDCVVQYHPPKSEYVNVHPHCLHLWRPTDDRIPRPPKIMIG